MRYIIFPMYLVKEEFFGRKTPVSGKIYRFRSVPGNIFSAGIRSARAEFRPVGADSASPRAEAAGRADSGVFRPVSGDFRARNRVSRVEAAAGRPDFVFR